MVVIRNYQVIELRNIKSAVYPNKDMIKSQHGHVKETCLLILPHHQHGGKKGSNAHSGGLISQDQS